MKQLTILAFIACISAVTSAQRPVATYYDRNQIHPHEQYSVNSVGQKTGPYKEYDEYGVVIYEINYLNGEMNGQYIQYHAVSRTQHIVALKAYYKGDKKDGYYVEYNEQTGYKTKLNEGHYRQNEKAGAWREWGFVDGKPDAIRTKAEYVDGQLDGTWTLYDDVDTGKVASSGKYANGKRVGEWTLLFDNYDKLCERKSQARSSVKITFDNDGKVVGPAIVTDVIKGGYIEVSMSFSDDVFGRAYHRMVFNGKCTWFYPDGKKKEECNFVDDQRDGELVGYYEDGKVNYKQQFSNGQLVSKKCFTEDDKEIPCE